MLPGVRRCTPMKRPHAVPQARERRRCVEAIALKDAATPAAVKPARVLVAVPGPRTGRCGLHRCRRCRVLQGYRFYTSRLGPEHARTIVSMRFSLASSSLGRRPLRGRGRPASGPATAEVGAWNWAPLLRGASCTSAGCWRNRREVTDRRDGTPWDALRLVSLLRASTYVLFIERSSARCSCRESRAGGTISSRSPLQRSQARSGAVRDRGVGGVPTASHRAPATAKQAFR